jgi:hypothetical protein
VIVRFKPFEAIVFGWRICYMGGPWIFKRVEHGFGWSWIDLGPFRIWKEDK